MTKETELLLRISNLQNENDRLRAYVYKLEGEVTDFQNRWQVREDTKKTLRCLP